MKKWLVCGIDPMGEEFRGVAKTNDSEEAVKIVVEQRWSALQDGLDENIQKEDFEILSVEPLTRHAGYDGVYCCVPDEENEDEENEDEEDGEDEDSEDEETKLPS